MAERFKDEYRRALEVNPDTNLISEIRAAAEVIAEGRVATVAGLVSTGIGLLIERFIRRKVGESKVSKLPLLIEGGSMLLGGVLIWEGICRERLGRQGLDVLREESTRRSAIRGQERRA